MIVFVLISLGVIGLSVGTIVQDGQCNPNIELYNNFDINAFLGDWEEHRTSDPVGADCAGYKFSASGNSFSTIRDEVLENFANSRNGTVTVETGTPKLEINYDDSSNPIHLWMITGDQGLSIFVVTYSCVNISLDEREVSISVLQRPGATLTTLMVSLINTRLNELGITFESLRQVSHSDDACYILPIIEPGNPIILDGVCDQNINVLQNFNVEGFTGVWHEISSYYSENSNNQCSRAEYSLVNGVVNVINSQVVNQALETITGTATIIGDDGSARLSVNLNVNNETVTQELLILATDYTNYAISYTCVNLGDNRKRVFSWILGRRRQPSASVQADIDRVIASEVVLNKAYYRDTTRTDEACFYYPEPNGQPAEFRGSCNQNIPVVQNFNPELYKGLWHDIASYPSVFQTGTCRNANYELNGGVVDVLNTQVLAEALDTMRGTAVLATDDGSAKLTVTFPIVGTNESATMSYWVISTDYESYSLVYSCEDLEETEDMRVWAWKLSRTKVLTVEASAAITAAMANIPVLGEQYFEQVDQSREGCFYYPEPEEGVVVLFPGLCDENSSVVENFDIERFSNEWYEVEAYPRVNQEGVCISHRCTLSDDSLALTTSQVIDQLLKVHNGTLRHSSSDNSGKLILTLPDSGVEMPFWILSTDYDNYAIAYGCVQHNDDFRAIYSWKFSRTKALSAVASAAIANAIENVQVLHQRYYEEMDQSDDACFYLPDLEPGEPVVLFGTCDPSIPVVPDFNATRYLGRWRLIESYPSDFQGGTCNEATYEDNGLTIDVINTQVESETLIEEIGSASVLDNGKLSVTFPGAPDPVEYWVLDTDYDTFSLVYSCQNISPDQRRVWSWKLSRARSLPQEAVARINAKIDTVNVLNNRYFVTIDQSDTGCFYYPEPDRNTPLRLRGRCDQNIQVVQNFNVTRYTGLWHNIELYPSDFQRGTCHNAEYTEREDGVHVFNTQVVDEALDVMTGSAAVASADGSAKLSVTFPVAGTDTTVTTSYWVLATDYDSYSLVYTCEDDPDDDYRLVYSWKLSRTKQLSAAAETAINNVIRDIKVLDDRYYFDSNQTPEGCFYHPTPQPGQVVRYPGQCSDDINVVQNFNLTTFEGIWYEIDAYPKDQQQGQCISHLFTPQSVNSLNLQSSQVAAQTLSSNNGVLLFSVPDSTDARMTININVNGEDITIPFWILSTDYVDYALAYSCVNQGTDYRNVFSWKLSRPRTLSAFASSNINSVIASVNVLRQDYYEIVEQTPDACFHYPDLSPGEPVVFHGQCDESIPAVSNFNPALYLNRWRTIQSYASEFETGDCGQATYSLASDGQTVDVYNTQVVNETLDEMRGTAVVASTDGSGKLLVSFSTTPEPANYWILATDYDSYALVYSCMNVDAENRRVWAWKLSRDTSLSNAANAAFNAAMEGINVLDDRYFTPMDQSDEACFYFPEPERNTPVRLRGKCEDNIQVVQNFNVTRYTGLWHNIELYPSDFQRGTCHNAEYTEREDGVHVFNTQVVDEALDVMTGSAAVASADGSAKLSVTFPVAGTDTTVTTSYWVLATDYDSYSLVYTCEDDPDDDYRLVYSWKLSRTKQLSAAAETAINNVIRDIKVLDDRYYFDSNQTPEGCFYHPTPQPGQVVRYPGQCSDDINVVQNFNLTTFEGIWYEIEAYPKDQQQGQCISHVFTPQSVNSLNLQSSQVAAQTLSSNNGVLLFSVPDSTDARMTININVNGEDITIPFWILSTDYDDYALAYSCVNQGTDYRNVFSWKLSRQRTLSASASSNINSVIASVNVLRQDYYEIVEQTPDACFHYPDLSPGEPVVFHGQCDESIPAVSNFNPALYLNRWRTIQSYASEFETGDCGQATYSLASDGQTVDVYNTQVANETLDELRGTAVVASTDGSGKLLVSFPTTPEPANYWILATDYDSYALVYSCMNVDAENRRVWAWKLSRDTTLSNAANAAINTNMEGINVLDDRYFTPMDQSEEACFYYPEMQGQPLRFRGRCNENIPVVDNFDVQMYKGSWNDIESYPQQFQFGSCPTAEYTIRDDGVDVFNTQVVDQELDTIAGRAVVASSDGSAKLTVTFPVAGTSETVSSPYWVLDTDYENYSLVYSCQNIDEEYYGVTSWKLSRSKELSSEHRATIDETMASVKVLRQQYYVSQDHTDEGCFFYPDNAGGPVTWEGQCENDEDINTVLDFNRQQFAATWYEIEHIPSEVQTGGCVADKYELSDGGFSLTKTLVSDEKLTTYTTAAEVSDNAAMSVTLVDDQGEQIAVKLYVLATDYNNYALLYGCRNVNETQKQVYGYKLSRDQSGLSASAVASISEAVAERGDITEKYFEKTAQDVDACFYYPEYDDSEDVIRLPGPCPAVRGVANFNAETYLGRWYEVARYPDANQAGACNQATYTSGDGVVDVLNTQVVAAALETQEGSAVVASTDGTGQLTVTFVVDGETRTASYYVLATDYTSYSLVYNCRNTDDGWSTVFSWKLSRAKTLSNQANTAIDSVVSSTRGLLESYYRSTDQSDAACFYVPPLTPGQAVRFRGRCDQYPAGMQNFDKQKYLNGWWHEIEGYTTSSNAGECISTQYEQAGNQVAFTHTRVFSTEDGRRSTGTADAEENGRIVKTYGDGSTENLWVIATDYDSYALLLTCENDDDEYVKVWSTKQSRSRSLTQTVQDTLTEVINTNQLLYAHLYVPVQQTDDACFYYPERQGQRIILPGRCDSGITVQNNFNATSYTGTWYQIERYPYPEVADDSRCIGTRYTLPADSDVIEVLNWENVEDEVNSINGTAVVNESTATFTVTLGTDPENDITTTTNLYVLSTDYVTYSLVYTCTNYDDYHRSIVAAKLSRTRSLVNTATTAINSYMSQRQELNQRYFIQVEHDEECQDPSSAVLFRSSAIVFLVCLILRSLF